MPGMAIAVDQPVWTSFQNARPATLARDMVRWCAHARLGAFRKHPRGPKIPVPKRTRFPDKTHVSTARLLEESRKTSR
jgi:hypothetical protein